MKLVLVGTGTGVGKTHVACALLRAARDAGILLTSWKPIETGVSGAAGGAPTTDATALLGTGQPNHPTTYALPDAVSPHLAARRAGMPISQAHLTAVAPPRPCLIETAGGLFTPLDDEGHTNHDLARALEAEPLWLVAPDRLGVLHDVGAVVRAARVAGPAIAAIVLNDFGPLDPSHGTNQAELGALGLPVWTVPQAIATMLSWLKRSPPT